MLPDSLPCWRVPSACSSVGSLRDALNTNYSKLTRSAKQARLSKNLRKRRRAESFLRCEGLDSGGSGEDRRTNSLKQGKVPRGHSDARTSCPPSETVESDQDGRSYWTIVSSRRTNPSSSFSASHNSDARLAGFRSNIGSVLVSSGSLEGARRRKETMEERTGNVSHRCSRRINPIPNRWIPLIFLGLKKCSLVVISGRFLGVTVSPPSIPESFPVHPCTS